MIIGITGTNGAGKTTVVDILKDQDFTHYSVREFIVEEIKRRNLPVNRPSMQSVANDLRVRFGGSYIVDALYNKAQEAGGNAVIESIRALPEVESLRRHQDFFLLSVDALEQLRYERITGRNNETDRIGFETWQKEQAAEMDNSDPSMQNIKGCMAEADYTIDNSGSKEELENSVGDALWEFRNKSKKQKKSIW
jgi:dephospho-CoA kinase